jgi:hypothetical protein
MSLFNLIINRILQDGEVTLAQLEQRAKERAVLLSDLYAALEQVHRDKRVTRKVIGGEIVYVKATPKKSPTEHLAWLRENYPWPSNFEMPFPDIEMPHLFLKPDELIAYKAKAKGVPTHMVKSHYGNNTRGKSAT